MFEYKVVPAPRKGLKGKGIKGTEARFANALQAVMNELGADGWDYQRTDTLPVEERQGLTGKITTFQNMLVFRRPLEVEASTEIDAVALIEDQTPDTPDLIASAESDNADDIETEGAPEKTDDGAKRVSETLEAPFVFPWNKRAGAAKKADRDDPQVAAE